MALLRGGSPLRRLDVGDAEELIRLGGYVHPLFTDPEYVEQSTFASRPWPGQALLLVMGGLLEQTGLFDELAVALVGYDSVGFVAPAFDGDVIKVEVEQTDLIPGRSFDVGLFRCTAIRSDEQVLVETIMRFLLRKDAQSLSNTMTDRASEEASIPKS